jgi:hypothetical protein
MMRYHYRQPEFYMSHYGEIYSCDHPVYSRCTLYRMGEKGLAVIQQRFRPGDKTTSWGEIDPWLTDALYLHAGFRALFSERAGPDKDGLYPTMTVRQMMWALKMKPLPKERWETAFDRRDI